MIERGLMEPDKDDIATNPPSDSSNQPPQTVSPIATSSSHGQRNPDRQPVSRTVIQQTPQRVVTGGVIKQSTPATVTTAVLVINTLLPDKFASKEIKKEFNP